MKTFSMPIIFLNIGNKGQTADWCYSWHFIYMNPMAGNFWSCLNIFMVIYSPKQEKKKLWLILGIKRKQSLVLSHLKATSGTRFGHRCVCPVLKNHCHWKSKFNIREMQRCPYYSFLEKTFWKDHLPFRPFKISSCFIGPRKLEESATI